MPKRRSDQQEKIALLRTLYDQGIQLRKISQGVLGTQMEEAVLAVAQ